MQPTDPVHDALRHLREEQPSPLMSESDVARLIASAPLPSITKASPSFVVDRWTWFVGSAVILTGIVAALILLPTAEVRTPPPTDTAQETEVTPSLPVTPPLPLTSPLPPTPLRDQSTSEVQTITDETPSAPPLRPTRTLKLSTADLAALGLKFTGDALRYVEDGVSITVRTNGISAHGQRIPSDLRTPRHITLYRKGLNLARWIDVSAPDVDVNSLIGVQVWLQDSTMPMFREADVILWYAPTADVLSVLPQDMLHKLQQSDAAELRSTTASIASMVVAPNPIRSSDATLLFDVVTPCVSTVRLIDMMGREANIPLNDSYTLNIGRESIALTSLESLPNGMYNVVVEIPSTQERLVQRLLIER